MTGDAITRIMHELEFCNLNMTNETTDLLLENLNPCAHPECEHGYSCHSECTRWYFDGELRCTACVEFFFLSLSHSYARNVCMCTRVRCMRTNNDQFTLLMLNNCPT